MEFIFEEKMDKEGIDEDWRGYGMDIEVASVLSCTIFLYFFFSFFNKYFYIHGCT